MVKGVELIIFDWLKRLPPMAVFTTGDIQTKTKEHGDLFFLEYHNYDTYNRTWRKMRSDPTFHSTLDLNGIALEEVPQRGRSKAWRIIKST